MPNIVPHNMTLKKSIRKSFLIILSLCFLLVSPSLAKEDISIGLSLDRNKATTMDTIQMTGFQYSVYLLDTYDPATVERF